MERDRSEISVVRTLEGWHHWPVYWSAIWVGTLAALSTALVLGLMGIAVGAHQMGPSGNIVRWSDFGLGALFFTVFGAFISAVVGGWIAGRIAGLRSSEPAMLHGAIVWLLGVPILVAFAALGVGGFFGGWYGGLIGGPVWAASPTTVVDPSAAIAARNSALATLLGLLLGLVGGVIGGWMASGEPMSFTAHRHRDMRVEHRRVA